MRKSHGDLLGPTKIDHSTTDLPAARDPTVKGLAEELHQAFEANGVHREALAALRLFHEAAERETATAELARRVLDYLFKARHDRELRFES